MLEILLVVFLCKKLGAMVRAKGRSPGWYQAMLVGMWVGGEVSGGVVGIFLANGEVTSAAYVAALAGAAIGAIGAFLVVKSLSSLQKTHPYTGGFPVVEPIGEVAKMAPGEND